MSGKLRGCCAATLTQLIAELRRKQHAERHNSEVVRGLEQAVVIAKGLAGLQAK
jgi:hypothetical protein